MKSLRLYLMAALVVCGFALKADNLYQLSPRTKEIKGLELTADKKNPNHKVLQVTTESPNPLCFTMVLSGKHDTFSITARTEFKIKGIKVNGEVAKVTVRANGKGEYEEAAFPLTMNSKDKARVKIKGEADTEVKVEIVLDK